MNTSIPVKLIENSGGLGDCPGYKTAGVAGDIREIGDTERLDVALFTADSRKVPTTSLAVFPIAVMPMLRLANKA